jgi:phosphoribosylcarboxyaminoimidazole (NCAIR) mutase
VSIGGAANAALLGAAILALSDEDVAAKLAARRKRLAKNVEEADRKLSSS